MNETIVYDEERFLTVTSSYNGTNETSPQLLRDLPDYMEVNGEEPGENHTAIIATGCYMRDCAKMPNTQSHQDSTTEYPRKLKTQVLSKEQLLLPLGLSILDEEFVKNVVGRVQVEEYPIMQTNRSSVSAVDTIKWVNNGTWLSQPEGAKGMVLEAYPGWFFMGEVMDHMWLVAKRFVQQVGAWMLDKTNVLPHEKEPPDPPSRPVRGAEYYFKAIMTLLLPLMWQQHALAQVPIFEFQSVLSRVQDAGFCGIQDQYIYNQSEE